MASYKEKLKQLSQEEQRYIEEKAFEYQKKFGIENSGDGWNDTTDAFRHAWGSAYLSMKYGNKLAHLATTGHELTEFGQPNSERTMDEWNNFVGRKITQNINKNHKNLKQIHSWSEIEDIIAEEAYEKVKENKLIVMPSKNKPAKLTSGMLQNQLASQNDAKANFLQRIYMESDGIQKRFKGEVPEGYKNPHLDNDKIFTKEEIDKMTWAETKKNQQAINYQKKVMGVPTKQQAEKAASKKGSGLVHVSGYTTSDGRKVADYYRALPRK